LEFLFLHSGSLGHIHLLILVSLGFFAGILNGFLGIGGGILIVPLLHYLGAPVGIAVGTSMAYIAGTTFFSTLKNLRKRNISYSIGFVTALSMLPAVELGSQIVHHLEQTRPEWAATTIRLGLLALTIYIVLSFFTNKKTHDCSHAGFVKTEVKPFILVPLGLFTGFLAGYLGVGGGIILLPVFAQILHLNMRLSVGTSSFVILLISIYGGASYFFKGAVDLPVAFFLVLGASFGATLGTSALHHASDRLVKFSFATIASAVGLSLLMKETGLLGHFALFFLLGTTALVTINILLHTIKKS
jgi:uncharacterized membrane protein YfcA